MVVEGLQTGQILLFVLGFYCEFCQGSLKSVETNIMKIVISS